MLTAVNCVASRICARVIMIAIISSGSMITTSEEENKVKNSQDEY